MKMLAHTLKSCSGYVGAGKVYYACLYIALASQGDTDEKEMIKYYPLLVEACVGLKRYSRKYLAANKGKLKTCFIAYSE